MNILDKTIIGNISHTYCLFHQIVFCGSRYIRIISVLGEHTAFEVFVLQYRLQGEARANIANALAKPDE